MKNECKYSNIPLIDLMTSNFFRQSPQENMLSKVRTLENRIQIIANQVNCPYSNFHIFSSLSLSLVLFQQAHMFDYLECLMDGLRIVGGDRIRMPERRRFDPEESCMYSLIFIFSFLFLSRKTKSLTKHEWDHFVSLSLST